MELVSPKICKCPSEIQVGGHWCPSEILNSGTTLIVLLSNVYCVDFWNVFEFNAAAMQGIYTKRPVIIPVTKKLYPWFKWRGLKVLIR